jgi:hypothetical protein
MMHGSPVITMMHGSPVITMMHGSPVITMMHGPINVTYESLRFLQNILNYLFSYSSFFLVFIPLSNLVAL